MTANDSASNEISSHLPRSFQLLAAWCHEKGLIERPQRDGEDPVKEK
jgi:hypothetical protein